MKAVLYCRKSTDDKDKQVMSLSAQEHEMCQIAERSGIEIVKTFTESMSAKAPGRIEFNKMLDFIRSGEANIILSWGLDRLARNPIDGAQIIWALQQNVITAIKTYGQDYLPTDDVTLMYIQFGQSHQQVKKLSTDVKRGNREKLRRGEWPNHAPYGYRNDTNTKLLKINKLQAENVKQIYQLYIEERLSFSKIASQLNLRKSLIERVLGKTFYYGLMERNGEYFPGKHQPIISKEVYDEAQRIKSGVTVNHSRGQDLFFPYRGLMRCAECGCQLTATRKKKVNDYYYCTNGKGTCTQHHNYLTKKDTLELFSEALRQLKFDDEIIEIMYESARERHENGSYDSQKVLAELTLEIDQITKQERKLLQSYTKELISDDLYKEEATKLKNQKSALESKKKNYTENSHNGLMTLELTKEVFLAGNRAISEFLDASPERKRRMLKKLLWNLEVKDKKPLIFNYKNEYAVLANAPKSGDIATLLAVSS